MTDTREKEVEAAAKSLARSHAIEEMNCNPDEAHFYAENNWADWAARAGSVINVLSKLRRAEPIDMILFCPKCGLQHIDAPDERTPDWTNPPHKSHLCHGCGCIWRPADVATNGVKHVATQGKRDNFLFFGPGRQAPLHLPPNSEELREILAQEYERERPGDFATANYFRQKDTNGNLTVRIALAAMSRLRHPEVNARLLEALRLVLPLAKGLAKGYAPFGQSEQAKKTCRLWIETAEEAIAAAERASAQSEGGGVDGLG